MINLIHSDQACVSLLDMKSQTKNLTIFSIVQFKTLIVDRAIDKLKGELREKEMEQIHPLYYR